MYSLPDSKDFSDITIPLPLVFNLSFSRRRILNFCNIVWISSLEHLCVRHIAPNVLCGRWHLSCIFMCVRAGVPVCVLHQYAEFYTVVVIYCRSRSANLEGRWNKTITSRLFRETGRRPKKIRRGCLLFLFQFIVHINMCVYLVYI